MSVTVRAIERVVRENSMGEVERWACTRAKVYYLKTRRGEGSEMRMEGVGRVFGNTVITDA